ncbi:hypothetical protein [Flavobacterium covae]|nr:hypothetical protein [Flavobacterium covae]
MKELNVYEQKTQEIYSALKGLNLKTAEQILQRVSKELQISSIVS